MSDKTAAELEAEKKAENPTPEKEPTDEGTDQKPTDSGDVVKEEGIDYKAAAEALESQVKEKDKIIGNKNRAIKAMKKGGDEVLPEPDEDQLLAMEVRLEERQDKKMAEIRIETNAQLIDSTIARVTANVDEAKLIKMHLKHTVKPSGDIMQDVKNAQALANQGKLVIQNEEMAAAMVSKATSASAPSFGGQKEPQDTKDAQPTDADIRVANKFFKGDVKKYMKHKETSYDTPLFTGTKNK